MTEDQLYDAFEEYRFRYGNVDADVCFWMQYLISDPPKVPLSKK